MRHFWILTLGILCFACTTQHQDHDDHAGHDYKHHDHDHKHHGHNHDDTDHDHDHDHEDGKPHRHHSIGDGPGAGVEVNEKVLLTKDVKWEQLNPARGDQSPQAGTLWGSRTHNGAAGFLLKPVDGFRSPPHIHNVAYRGVVISGLLHNDDPDAADMWMPAGSFWTQPAGEVHITAAKGNNVIAYIEVEDWFGVQPPDGAFDDGERPVNIYASNLIWLQASQIKWISPEGGQASDVKVSYLWGTPKQGKMHGLMLKLSASDLVKLKPTGKEFRMVVIKGSIQYQSPEAMVKLTPGSYLRANQSEELNLTPESEGYALVYIRTNGHFELLK